MKVTVLGSGTSTGVPMVGCDCRVCTSTDEKNKRRRASIMVEKDGYRIVIDTGPDFRDQMLENSIDSVDAVLYTHFHYDHMGGLDDLRPFSKRKEEGLKCYCDNRTYDEIIRKYPYVQKQKSYPNTPRLDFTVLEAENDGRFNTLNLGPFHIQPIRLLHVPAAMLFSVGYVFNSTFGYLTDFKEINEDDIVHLKDLEVLYLGSPLPKEHPTHISHPEALELFSNLTPQKGFIGHLSHMLSHDELSEKWPENIEPAHDRMSLTFQV